ncbi:MAG: glycosyltransferase, partial [Parcubacteria group bacterium]
RFSVIIPTYNRVRLLPRAIASVLNQTNTDFELIIVDDGSTDGTRSVVADFQNPRIKYLTHATNKGYAAALNTGIAAATGEYIAFQDSDDEWRADKLENHWRVFHESGHEVGVVYSGFWRVSSRGRQFIPGRDVMKREGNLREALLAGNFIGAPASVVRRACFERVGLFDEQLARRQDWEFWLRLSGQYEFRYIDEPLLRANDSPDSMSNDNRLAGAMQYLLEKHHDLFETRPAVYAKHCFEIASLLFREGQMARGRQWAWEALRRRPWTLKYSMAIVISVLGRGNYLRFAKLKNIFSR